MKAPFAVALAVLAAWPSVAWSGPLTDEEIAQIIVRESRRGYFATGHPCPCPDDLLPNGNRCAGQSAYGGPGERGPSCYVSDVPQSRIDEFRNRQRALDEARAAERAVPEPLVTPRN